MKSNFLILALLATMSCMAEAAPHVLRIVPSSFGSACNAQNEVVLSSQAGVLKCGTISTFPNDCSVLVDQASIGSSYGYRLECLTENGEVARRASAGVVQCFNIHTIGACSVSLLTDSQWKPACDPARNEVVIAESADRVKCAIVDLR